ncbi:Tn3 family transposase [Spinactinospora alkalitolerans]
MLGNPDPAADQVDQRAYISAVTETFHSRLRRGDVFACGGLRWADPRAKLLDAQQWQTAKHDVLTSLELPEDPQPHLTELTGKLDTAYRVVADRAEDGEEQPATVGADGRLHLDKPDPREVSDEQTELSRVCAAMLPQIDLPDLIMEVHGWTGCLDEYTHLSEADARMSELPTSVAACLVAEACNVGFTPVIQPGHSALSRSRLSHVQQNYLRPDTHRAANARLPENQADIDLVSQWGTGAVASLMRITQGGGSPTTLGKALAEYGRIAKTLHMLAFVDADETYRRRIHTQLNTQESRHALARQIFHGKRGQLYQPYRQGQEDQLGALGLVLNMVALWNTVYLDAIINHLRSQGYPVRDEDLARLSPLGWRHINLQGRYAFISSPPSELRPLRDPDDEL